MPPQVPDRVVDVVLPQPSGSLGVTFQVRRYTEGGKDVFFVVINDVVAGSPGAAVMERAATRLTSMGMALPPMH